MVKTLATSRSYCSYRLPALLALLFLPLAGLLARAESPDPASLEKLAGAWVQAFQNPDPAVRQRVADALARNIPRLVKPERFTDPLLTLAKDTELPVRLATLRGLGAIGSPAVVPALQAALTDPLPPVRATAIDGLGQCREPALIASIFPLTGDPDPSVRGAAAVALGLLDAQATMETLLTLAQDKEITVRAKALQALGACTNPRALDVVLPATSEKDYRVRLGAIQGLARNHDQRALDALREMITGYPENRLPWPSAAAAITSLRAAWPKETADILLPLLARKEPNIREVLTHTLATCEDARIPAALMGIYDYQPYGVIGNALVEMGEKAIPDIFAGLVKASSGGIGGSIHRDDREVPPDFRPYIKLLRRIGLPATDYMIAILQQDGDSNRRRRAAFGLGRMEDPRTLPALREAMTDKSGDVRTNAVAALITLHDTSAVQLFVAGLKDADPRVRANCANALRKMQTDTAVPLLIRLLSDPDDDVRYNAAATLSAYQDPRSLEPLLNLLATERDWKAVYAVAGAVAKFKEERGKAQLLDMLDEDEYKYRRAAAAAALGGYHDPQVTERLLGMLDTDDFTIREGVLIGLGLSGDPDIVEKILAVPAKTKLFNDAETVTIALALMAPANVERLLPLLDENSGEAYSALEAFGSVRDPRLVAPALKLLASEDDALTVPAIELLEIQDDPSAIPAIVNAMERFYDSGMRQKDVRESGLHALKKLTGTDLGDETYLWREWWLCGLATPAKN